MKSKPSSHHLLPEIACLLFAFTAISCQTSTHSAADAPKTVTRSHWVKVSMQPPTYYPRGVSANAPTDHRSGEWIETGDDYGTCYFIPYHGLGGMDRQSLIGEALSARSERKLAAIAAEDEEICVRNIKNMTLFGPPVLIAGFAGGLVGGDIRKADIHELQKDWNTARNPQ